MKLTKGFIHIYKGDGKGKTTILNGMVVRAIGNDLKTVYLRFLKNRPSGEILFFQNQSNFILENFYNSSTKFFWEMNEAEKNTLKIETNEGLERLRYWSQRDDIDLIVVDEILGCIQNNLIEEKILIDILKQKKNHIEIALSGRYSSVPLEQIANLISEVKAKKHYFEKNIIAREGIDY